MPNKQTSVTIVSIDDASDGQRIDNFLITQLKGVPKSRIYQMIRKGEVRVNRGRIKPLYRLNLGDQVRIPPVRVASQNPQPKAGYHLSQQLEGCILFEDDKLLVLNKPAGLAVHGGSGINLGVIEALRQLRPDVQSLELVHRLDRDTSGCLLVAKKRSMLRFLHTALRQGEIEKTYIALVNGHWPTKCRKVSAPIYKYVLPSGERRVRIDPDGKLSTTLFRVIKQFSLHTLIEAKLITGRTHQIRIHAHHMGCPIHGDDKYTLATDSGARPLLIKRLCLHASTIKLALPDGERKEFEAPLGDNVVALLTQLDQETVKHK